ncbi:competence protein ComEC [Arthrobacter pascens]|uniref:ComEC/Rec2 family competence protein n=1 Tax=Arthrobacter pascens TaxID=1677 RepID=UPI00278FDF1E|nr:ComEC/Rec2 family competence protein [Arthrobacter pascens]MDQ0678272.1 competence protein ComEC [Arthrobacter pascens]
MSSRSPWSRYVESAVRVQALPDAAGPDGLLGAAGPDGRGTRAAGPDGHQAVGPVNARLTRPTSHVAAQVRGHLGKRLRGQARDAAGTDVPRRRTDLRLAFPALLVWCAAISGVWLTPEALAAVCGGLLSIAGLLLHRAGRAKARSGPQRAVPRSFLITSAVALLLAAAAAGHSAVTSSQRYDGPLAEAVKSGKSVVAVLEVAGSPHALAPAGQAGTSGRWSVAVTTVEITAGGQVVRARAQLVVMGGGDWGKLTPGQVVRTTGKLKAAESGQPEAGLLAATSAPMALSAAQGWQQAARELRSRYVSAAAFLAADPRGLLPGMVTGDTSALDEGLNTAMKAVGMTHLTAVSGANCSLVLGALLLVARSLRLPRLPAAVLALAGLGLFVVLVGPDASVLRAALMGSIALASLAGGRSGRGLSFLCLAVIGLLVFDPGLGTSYGFLLSVLATLGIIVLGQRMVRWTPTVVPRWVAAAFAVPLSAQMLCGPVIVLLQPQFSTYSLLANVVASPLVAPVTLLGTAAVPLVILAPWAATALIAVAGTFSAGVAWTARFTAALPGASLAWPEGAFGLLTMVLLSALTLGLVWMAVRPRQIVQCVVALHGRTEHLLELVERRVRRSRHYAVVNRLKGNGRPGRRG